MHIVVSGASGFVGRALVPALRAGGHEVRRLVRRRAGAADEIAWCPERGEVDAAGMEGCEGLVHLAGANIAEGRWTAARKRQIRASRTDSTELLARLVVDGRIRPTVWISASATGWYGSRGDEWLDEGSGPGAGFLAEVCRDWENATVAARATGVRVVNLRLGVVLAPGGGVLGKMLPFFRLGLGAIVGDGSNWMSWIAREDACRAVRATLEDARFAGPVNAVAPEPATSGQLARALGRVLGRPVLLRVPAALVRLALGEMAEATLLASQRVRPAVLENRGFCFGHRGVEAALHGASGVGNPRAGRAAP